MKKNILFSIVIIVSCIRIQSAFAQDKNYLDAQGGGYKGGYLKGLETLDNGLNFMVIGDWGRCGDYYQQEVADQLANASVSSDASFIISTGDNIYERGVISVNDPLWQKSYEDIYHQFSLQKDWYVVLGNHDYKTNPDAEVAYSKVSRRWHMPARYFAVKIPMSIKDTAKKALFVFLDTSPLVGKYYSDIEYNKEVVTADTVAEKAWLIKTLSDNDTNIVWRFVVGHHPLYTSGKRIKSPETKEIRGSLKWIFDKYNVDAYFCGHEHDLEYVKPAGKTKYFISGAGSEARPLDGKLPDSQFSSSDHGFMAFSITDDKLMMQTVNWKGEILYKATVDK